MTHPSRKTIGVIGCGKRITEVLKNLLKHADKGSVEITALYDTCEGNARTLQQQIAPNAKIYSSEAELLANGNNDWVAIGSINCFHAEQAIAALNAGKNVFCEKPLATNFEDCVRMHEAMEEATRRGQVFFFGLVLRYVPMYQKIKEYVDSGVLGKIISFEFNETVDFNHGGYIHGNWRRNRSLAGTHLLEKCCHDIDIVNWLLGSLPVKAASFGGKDFFIPENRPLADALGHNAEGKPAYGIWPDANRVDPFSPGADIVDNQVAIMQYSCGARASFHANCNAGIHERRICLLGSKGALRADAVANTIEFRPIGFDAKPEFPTLPEGKSHYGGDQVMGQAFADAVTNGRPPLATLEDGLRAAVSCFGIDEAMDTETVVNLRPLWEKVGIRP